MQVRNLDVLGSIVYWKTGDCNRQALKDRFTAIGFKDVVPYYRNNASILSQSARDYCSQILSKLGRYLVRPLKAGGVTIVEEIQGVEENSYPRLLSAHVDDQARVTTDPIAHEYEMNDIFQRLRDVCPGSHVTQSLVRCVDHLGGFSLRENGGIYWLPNAATAKWELVEKEVELTTLAGQECTFYAVRMVKDEKAMVAVHDAVVREIEQESSRIQEEILSGGLGKRALEERERQAAVLMAKIKPLQDLLGDSMASLQNSIDAAGGAAAAALLALEASSTSVNLVTA